VFLAAPPLALAQQFEIWCESHVLEFNNHVGNEWALALMVNGKSYSLHERILIETNASFVIRIVAEEEDKYPDIGFCDTTVSPDDDADETTLRRELVVVVRENRGRYRDNTAQWSFVIHVRRIFR
jgi:hypothetical protein